MRSPIQCLPLPEVYYDGHANSYWRENASGGWQKINETSLKTELISQGHFPYPKDGSLLSEVEVAKRDIQLHQDILFAGPLAGYDAGHQTILNQSILVTQSPRVIEARAGDWFLIRAITDGLLVNETVDQTPYLYGWLKTAYEALRERKLMPGQALVLAGPRECGKSLLQSLITEILGGRSAKPYQFMTGSTTFNAEQFGAEHLMVEDESASTDIRARRHFGAAIKNITVNTTQKCHPKNKQALTLTPFWRLSISVNDEPENLMVMPPMDDSITDKIILLKAHKCAMPMPTGSPQERQEFYRALCNELPAFLHAMTQWEIPKELSNPRFGICAYQHPELMETLTELQPELQLLAITDQCLFAHNPEWSGSAERLEKELTDSDAVFSNKAKKLFHYSNSCGTFLGRLSKHYPDRISSTKNNGTTIWTIKAPDQVENQPF